MNRISAVIVLSLLFSAMASAQSFQTRLNGFPAATTRVSGTDVRFNGNVGEPWVTTVSNLAGQKFITGTWKQVTRLRGIPDPSDESVPPVPFEFWLGQNYPNPFNPTTVIPFSLDEPGTAKLAILNLLGQTVRTVDLTGYSAGEHYFTWNGRDDFGNPVSSGPLFFRLTTEKHAALHRMILLK